MCEGGQPSNYSLRPECDRRLGLRSDAAVFVSDQCPVRMREDRMPCRPATASAAPRTTFPPASSSPPPAPSASRRAVPASDVGAHWLANAGIVSERHHEPRSCHPFMTPSIARAFGTGCPGVVMGTGWGARRIEDVRLLYAYPAAMTPYFTLCDGMVTGGEMSLIQLVPGAGVEPARGDPPTDFKSVASAIPPPGPGGA